jgi:hypothetical protein
MKTPLLLFAATVVGCGTAPTTPTAASRSHVADKQAAQPIANGSATVTPVIDAPAPAVNALQQTDFATVGGRSGGHGMIVFGDASGTWMSHIPMFHSPHDAQVILQVELSGLPAAKKSLDFSGANFTFSPDAFSLNDLISGRIDSFRGSLFRGNFELGGTEVAKQVQVKVVAVKLARALHELPAGETVAPVNEFYLVVGASRKEGITETSGTAVRPGVRNVQTAWTVHRIDQPPSYDLVARVLLYPNVGEAMESSFDSVPFTDDKWARLTSIPTNGLHGSFGAKMPNFAETGARKQIQATFHLIGSCLVGPEFATACSSANQTK